MLVCICGSSKCLSPGKHLLARLAPNGLKNAITSEHSVTSWFAQAPLANVGLATEPVVVLNVDPRHGGDESRLRPCGFGGTARAVQAQVPRQPPTSHSSKSP
ncbi:bifunctional DNA primase/polymerase [Methylobacterium durans]|uniref:DNA primase/polymerase bifunctional N-terminal domain-containing protein n=1 Tax=Methylobacterium durans TaxID=2202825 RepID=A0A2U8W3M8_9HYPH|nr:hypothetical protein DK389_09345 [Methylobacterium durans]